MSSMRQKKSSSEKHELITFHGHRCILGLHKNTIELTKDEEISLRADCIIGVNASKSCNDLSEEIKKHIWKGGRLNFILRVEDYSFSFSGRGDPKLLLTDEREIVLRKSDYLSSRTAAIKCDAAASDVPREIISTLQKPKTTGFLGIEIVENYRGGDEDSLWSLP